MGSTKHLVVAAILLVAILCASCLDGTRISQKQTKPRKDRQLIDMSIEELMEVPVVSVLKNRSQRLTDTPFEQMMSVSAMRTFTGKFRLTGESTYAVATYLDSSRQTVGSPEQTFA